MKRTLFVCLGVLCLVGPAAASEVVLRETACRLFDSRNVGGAGLGQKISQATIESFGNAGGVQGGETGCSVPVTATGAVVNIVAVDPNGPGWGRLWAYGATEPLSTSINSTGALTESTGLLVPLGAEGRLSWHSLYTGHLIVDLAGWLEPWGTGAGDMNQAALQGRVLWVKTQEDGNGPYRVEVGLFAQAPAGTPYSPYFACPVGSWDDCEPEDLMPQCTLNCEVSGEPPMLDSICYCADSFNPGECLKVAAFHDGNGLMASSIVHSDDCTPL